MGIHVRWMIRRDMPTVLEIENQNQCPWDEECFLQHLRQRNCIGHVVELRNTEQDYNEEGEEIIFPIIGFMVYELQRKAIHVLKINAKNDDAHIALFNKIISRLSPDRRTQIKIEVSETDLHFLKLARHLGFRAYNTTRDTHEIDGVSRDFINMVYRLIPNGSELVKNLLDL